MKLASGTLRRMPGRFAIARMLGPSYSLRCVLFHDISETESPFTKGLGVSITPADFEAALAFLTKNYTPVSLDDVLDGLAPPPRPVLVTFDDAYASVFQIALPLCAKLGVPAVLFANAVSLDNRCLTLDNLVCYVANVAGMGTINEAIRSLGKGEGVELTSMTDVFVRFLPAISLEMRQAFRDALVRLARINETDLASDAGLYLTSEQLRHLAARGFEIGNHTYTHVNCRCLSSGDLGLEIDRNKTALEEISRTRVRSFSVPYGSSADLTPSLVEHLLKSGYQAGFLVESLANGPYTDKLRIRRVSVKAQGDAALFSEIEVFPRLRVIRNWLSGATNLNPQSASKSLQ